MGLSSCLQSKVSASTVLVPVDPMHLILSGPCLLHEQQEVSNMSTFITRMHGGHARRCIRLFAAGSPTAAPKTPEGSKTQHRKPALLDRFSAKLQGGRFRWINEQLYTQDGSQALAMLAADPAMYAEYHQVPLLKLYTLIEELSATPVHLHCLALKCRLHTRACNLQSVVCWRIARCRSQLHEASESVLTVKLCLLAGCPHHAALCAQGFQQQVKRWPQQPLERAVAWVASLPAHCRVADFGCGDAQLARSVPHAVTSLDLVAANERVTACNMAHTPLGAPYSPDRMAATPRQCCMTL